MEYLGNIAAEVTRSIPLSCEHCNVSWDGCAAESFCPKCQAPKGFYSHDRNDCYCHICKPEIMEAPTRTGGA